jgi:hypothetical protein
MKSLQSLWMLCVLALGLAFGAACGPMEDFCPNTGSGMGGKCPITGDEKRPVNMDGGDTSVCPQGTHIAPNPDGNIVGICVAN